MIQLMSELHARGLKMIVLTGARAYPAQEDMHLIERLKQKAEIPWEWVDAKSAQEWLRVIGEARLLISGRFHHSIAAAFLKTPLIALNSNTPKMNGMLQMLSLPTPISMDAKQLSKHLTNIAIEAIEHPNQYIASDEVLDELCQLAKNNFNGIAIVA